MYSFTNFFAALVLSSSCCDCKWFIRGLHSTTRQRIYTTFFL